MTQLTCGHCETTFTIAARSRTQCPACHGSVSVPVELQGENAGSRPAVGVVFPLTLLSGVPAFCACGTAGRFNGTTLAGARRARVLWCAGGVALVAVAVADLARG